jgi:DNA-binding NarL/FixJ family response regulator
MVTEKRRPDAAILDVNLPGVSGYSLCRELRTIFSSELPIIFISGSRVDAIDRTAGMLIARLHRLLERSRLWSKAPSHDLSEREIEVLQLIAEGCPPAEVARQLVIAPKTVSSQMERILAQLDVHARAQAVAVADESGLIRVLRKNATHIAVGVGEN